MNNNGNVWKIVYKDDCVIEVLACSSKKYGQNTLHCFSSSALNSSVGGTTVSGFLWGNLINLRGNKLSLMTSQVQKEVLSRFDKFINHVMFYFYLMTVMVGITGLTGI